MANTGTADLSLSLVLEEPYLTDPYPLYQKLRSNTPIYWDEPLKSWVLMRYRDILAALSNPGITSPLPPDILSFLPLEMKEQGQHLIELQSRQFLYLDPPDHTRLRGLVNKAFTPHRVIKMRSSIQRVVDGLLDAMEQKGRGEILEDVAVPLATNAIALLIGVPSEDWEQFALWSEDLFTFGRGPYLHMPAQQWAQAVTGIMEFMDYLRKLAAQRLSRPQDDLLQILVTAQAERTLSEDEFLATCMLLIGAGNVTTINLIANGLYILLQHAEQMEEVKHDPALFPAAINEMLRYDGPAQQRMREAKEDVTVGDQQILRGQQIILCLGSANRDPEQFAEPDLFNIHRTDNRHFAFAHGPHYCVGSPLALLEAEVALSTVLQRFPKLHLAETETIEWKPIISRSLKKLPVVF
jgi:cytochrome P450